MTRAEFLINHCKCLWVYAESLTEAARAIEGGLAYDSLPAARQALGANIPDGWHCFSVTIQDETLNPEGI